MKSTDINARIINLAEVVRGTTTSTDALAFFVEMKKALNDGLKIKISLLDCSYMSSSFLNASFGEIFDIYGYDKMRSNISLINYKPSQAEQITSYLKTLNQIHN